MSQESVNTYDTGDLRGRGFFRHPPARISIIADRVADGGANALEELLHHELTHATDVRGAVVLCSGAQVLRAS